MSRRAGAVALIVCGSLVEDVRTLVRERKWEADVYGVSPLHHFRPERILEAVTERLERIDGAYEKVVVVYGDCGTAGRLDAVLRRYGATRPAGPHCYEMLAGEGFAEITEARPGTFFLTPWLIRNFDRCVVRRLGLDEDPELVSSYFRHFTDVVYLRRSADPELDRKAREIGDFLGLRLELRDTGLGELGRRLAELVEA
jgi:hypothetical protein